MKHLNILGLLLIGLVLSFFFGSFVAQASGASPLVVLIAGAVFALVSFIPKTPKGVLKADLSADLTAIKRYIDQHKNMLLRKFFFGMAIANDITLQANVKDKITLTKLLINGKPRPYTGNHLPNSGDIAYSDRDLEVGMFQRDFSLDPRQYNNTYLARYMQPGSNAGKTQIPFAEFTSETAVLANSSILNNRTAFFGEGKSAFATFNAGSTYAAGDLVKFTGADGEPHYYKANATTTAGQSPATTPAKWDNVDELAIAKGLGTIIKADRDNDVITNVSSTGAITSADGKDQALQVYRNLPAEMRDQKSGITLYGAHDVIDKITDGFADDIAKYTDADPNITYLPRTDRKCMLKRASWMAGSGMLIATTKDNLYMGTDLLSDLNQLNSIQQVYKLDIGLSGVIGFNFADADALAINDQD